MLSIFEINDETNMETRFFKMQFCDQAEEKTSNVFDEFPISQFPMSKTKQ